MSYQIDFSKTVNASITDKDKYYINTFIYVVGKNLINKPNQRKTTYKYRGQNRGERVSEKVKWMKEIKCMVIET